MTRLELLQLVVARARANGFELRRWYTSRLGLPWISPDAAVRLLEQQRRYYALLFSHEFASNFWKPGSQITFEVSAQSFERVMPDGSTRLVQRKPFIRRSARPDAWRYHLREMALAEEPLRYLRKYLHIEEQLEPEPETTEEPGKRGARKRGAAQEQAGDVQPVARKANPGKKPTPAKPVPGGLPAFLNRPYT